MKNLANELHPRVGIGILVVKGNQILLGDRISAHGSGTWCPPRGHLEFGESPQECAARELEEETSFIVKEVVTAQGLSLKEDDIGMYLSLEKYKSEVGSSGISMTRVLDEKRLHDFAKVFSDIGGYENLYDDLYSKLPPVLIADGGPYEMYVGYLDEKPVVTSILVLHANVSGIYYVMTVPQQRRKGFGTHAMKYLINRAKEKGYYLVTLQASADGKGLYERLGFKSICRFVEYA